jgi:hypothetical protein
MAVLNESQRARIVALIDYLAFNHDLPIHVDVVDQLDKIFGGNSGFPCACGVRGNSLQVSFRDEPIRTFLKLILALSDDATGGELAATPSGPLAP